MKLVNKTILAFLLIEVTFSIISDVSISQVSDIDSNKYKTVIIGKQEWMAENLNVEHYRNGDIIPEVKDSTEWRNLTSGAWCYYQNNSENGKVYGKLYNWYAVNDPRGLAPEGWHIPNDFEWTKLIDYLGGNSSAWIKMRSVILWKKYSIDGTNESGFNAYPGGGRVNYIDFCCIEGTCLFWSSTASYNNTTWNKNMASYLYLDYNGTKVGSTYFEKYVGLSCRCIKNNE